MDILFVGKSTKWYDIVRKNPDCYFVKLLKLVVEVYCERFVNDNFIDILNVELKCDCDKCATNMCHKRIIKEIIDILRIIDATKYARVFLMKERACKYIINHFIRKKMFVNPLVLVGETIKDRYKLTKKLTVGSGGVVFEATDMINNNEVIVKITSTHQTTINMMLNEHEIINSAKKYNTDYFPNIHDFFTIDPQIWLPSGKYHVTVMEKYGSDIFESVLNNKKYWKKGINIKHLQKIFYQLAKTLEILHEKLNIIHNDIKPENILFRKNNEDVLLIDYGLAIKYEGKKISIIRGTRAYMSPEENMGLSYDKSADIWSLALTMFEISSGIGVFQDDGIYVLSALTRIFPEFEKNIDKRFSLIKKPLYDTMGNTFENNYFSTHTQDPDLRDLLCACLKIKGDERLTIKQILQHRFFNIKYD